MGSSHSYLQNMATATSVTPVHWVKAGLCFELDVPDGKMAMALAAAGAAGKCSMVGYTQYDYLKKATIPIEGTVDFGVW